MRYLPVGVQFWIDPTWTDNGGWVVYGYVENGEEIQCRPDKKYCIDYRADLLDNLPLPPPYGTRISPPSTSTAYAPSNDYSSGFGITLSANFVFDKTLFSAVKDAIKKGTGSANWGVSLSGNVLLDYFCIPMTLGTFVHSAGISLFGGGMITQPDKLDFSLSERIMEQTGKDVWFLFYPLCSEDVKIDKTYEVSFEAYKLMTETYKAENISVLGFSSGACLSLGIFLHNNALGRPLPMAGKIISVSPGGLPDVSLEKNKEVWEKLNALNHKDIVIDPTYFKTAREITKGDADLPEYMLDGTVGDFSGFPKTYFYYGGNECLYAFAEYFKKAMEKYKAPYKIIVGEGMCHCYPLLRFFREGREAQDEIIELLKS
ncbi:alpha/beta hydrolase [Treponema phagedenis]|uniref:alpha/beta hydrolase n=1 Tax=Treponema phagedenis TaxID=162 RepID=UPI001C079299|nr:alpha/beta hydrolase [Treponema phagedenis]